MNAGSSRAAVARLESIVGHHFADQDLARRALTHSSAVTGTHLDTYERLEFLGDRVLGLIVAELLLEAYPKAEEGEIAKRHAKLVSRKLCAEVAQVASLDEILLLGASERKGGGSKKVNLLADVTESVIAALYRDGGLDAAARFVREHWARRVEMFEGPLRDAKTELQEWAHAQGRETPIYREISRSGPDHAPTFVVAVTVAGIEDGVGEGASKRDAEHRAAQSLLERERVRRAS